MLTLPNKKRRMCIRGMHDSAHQLVAPTACLRRLPQSCAFHFLICCSLHRNLALEQPLGCAAQFSTRNVLLSAPPSRVQDSYRLSTYTPRVNIHVDRTTGFMHTRECYNHKEESHQQPASGELELRARSAEGRKTNVFTRGPSYQPTSCTC